MQENNSIQNDEIISEDNITTKKVNFFKRVIRFGIRVIRKILGFISKILMKTFPRTTKFLKKIRLNIYKFLYSKFYNHIKVDEKLVLFDSFLGKGYSCNPKGLYKRMREDPYFEDFTFVWVKNGKPRVHGSKNVRYFSGKYFYYLAKAKYWVFNSRMPRTTLKKPDQIYLQTWHGTPLKKLGKDIDVGKDTTFYRTQMSYEEMINLYDVDAAKYNYMISPNPFSTQCFSTAFGVNRERLIETGYPRNDMLVNATKEDIEQLKIKLNIPLDKKIILYAPTWRDNIYDVSGYTFTPKADFAKWRKKLGKDYYLIYKPHYLIKNKIYEEDLSDFMKFAKSTNDINVYYLVSDILITDYSSVFFDYAVLKRDMLFYMFDMESYASELRGFYFDINELPGPIIQDEDELLENILNIESSREQYAEKYKLFLDKFCALEDGHSADRVIDIVFKNKGGN